MPNAMRVDVTPPPLDSGPSGGGAFSPDGDGRAEGVGFRYRLNEEGKGMLFVDGRRRVMTLFARLGG